MFTKFGVLSIFDFGGTKVFEMDIGYYLIIFVDLVALVLGMLSAMVIFYFGVKANPANLPLAIGQLSISIAVFVSFLLVTQWIVHLPFFYRLGNVFVLIFIPMPFLYTLLHTKSRSWRWYDFIHFVPLLLYLVDFWEVLTLSNAEKLELVVQEIKDLNVVGKFNQSRFFGPGFHQEFRTALFSAYWLAQVVVLANWIREKGPMTPKERVWKNWVFFFLGCQVFMWAPFYLSIAGMDIMTTYHIVNSFSILWIMISSISLFFFPSLLYGGVPDKSTEGRFLLKKPPTKPSDLVEERNKLEEIFDKIDSGMHRYHYYLNQGYNINDLSKDMDIPVYQISKSLNIVKGMGFVDYINQNRIKYCVLKYGRGEWLNFTVEAVASECGFSNRNTFAKAFKKIKGISPSEYRESLGAKN